VRLRNKIKEKLIEIDDKIYYGIVPENVKNSDWNYFVFGQEKLKKSGSSLNDLNGYWYVTIVREDFIPDNLVFEVINKLTEISGLRLADGEFNYTYTFKGNTNIVVEILELQFTKMKKGCN
jgi:hypothetical protein